MGSYFETVNRIFRDDAVPALAEYVSIRCLSPSFQADWSDLGEIDRAVELIDAWARQRKIPGLSTRVSRIPNRTPALVVTIPGTQCRRRVKLEPKRRAKMKPRPVSRSSRFAVPLARLGALPGLDSSIGS